MTKGCVQKLEEQPAPKLQRGERCLPIAHLLRIPSDAGGARAFKATHGDAVDLEAIPRDRLARGCRGTPCRCWMTFELGRPVALRRFQTPQFGLAFAEHFLSVQSPSARGSLNIHCPCRCWMWVASLYSSRLIWPIQPAARPKDWADGRVPSIPQLTSRPAQTAAAVITHAR